MTVSVFDPSNRVMSRIERGYESCEICKTIDSVHVIYSKGYRETLSKVTRIAKITKFTKTAKCMIIRHTTCKIKEIYTKGCREGPSKVTKFTIICHTTCKINKIYAKGCREGPSKGTKFAKTAKFTIIRPIC